MTHTTETRSRRPHVTALAAAIIRAKGDHTYADMLRMTAPVYGHDNREVIGRAQASLLDRLR